MAVLGQDRRWYRSFDWALFGLVCCICFCGLGVLYSAGYDPDTEGLRLAFLSFDIKSRPFYKQLTFLGIGLVPLVIGACIPLRLFYRYSYPLYAAIFLSLLVVRQFGVVYNGSRRWLDIGPVHLQPAELMKLALVLCLARFLAARLPPKGGYTLKQVITPAALAFIPMGLVVTQPDLGTGLVIGSIGAMMILFTGVRWQVLAGGIIAVVLGAIPVWHKLHDYQKQRILVLFDPMLDPQGSGYHIAQSKIAIGSGGFSGKGYLKGTQAHLEFLPEHTTDFIFSVLAEEWGFVGCVCVLTLYLLLLVRILFLAKSVRDNFACLIVFGIGFGLFFHTVVNVGMVLGVLPVVGIPLPLFSYGGSSLWSTLFSLGILLGISVRRGQQLNVHR